MSLNKVKIGEVKVSVPVLDKQGGIAGRKDTHRNQWKIKNLSLPTEQRQELKNEEKVEHLIENQEIKLNS